MIRRNFLKRTITTVIALFGGLEVFSKAKSTMRIHFLRHATFVLEVNDMFILVDPMFNKKDAMDTVANAANSLRNPLVDLPVSDEELSTILKKVDAVMVTHTHRDHWDTKAVELLDKKTTILCQPSDEEKIKGQGFANVKAVSDQLIFNGLIIHRTGGQHGSGETGKRMGMVSGFIVEFKNQRLYVAGDTIWCSEVESALAAFNPDIVVLNAGAAQFVEGGPITMNADDVVKVVKKQPKARIIAVHMEAINHCLLKRSDLKSELSKQNLLSRVSIPDDGDFI